MKSHILPIRVYYEDTDAGGVVYYANYLKFAERGRTELLRTVGLENSGLRAACGILIVVKTLTIDYKKPAVLDDSLILETRVVEIGATSLEMQQIFSRDAKEIAEMNVTLVCVSVGNGRPVRWPSQVTAAFAA